MTRRAALAFVRRHGIVLERARGALPNLVEAIAGGPVRGSWWAHPRAHAIFRILGAVRASPDVLACRLAEGRVTLVHRRLWPAVVRLSRRVPRARLAAVREAHTAAGRHAVNEIPYPRWVPAEVKRRARAMSDAQAERMLGDAGAAVFRGGGR